MLSVEKQPGILASDAEVADNKQPAGSKFDQMKEQLRMTELNRAQANLKAMKVFRVQNEKMYADKELQELRRKEIQEPLDEAMITIEVLQGKLQRRDDMIQKLKHYISVDLLKVSQNSPDENRTKVVELNQVEEHNQILLMDTIAELQRTMEGQQGRVTRCKTTIADQQERIKELVNELQVQEFNHKEHIRHIESDKDIYLGMVESREHKIEVLMEEKEGLEEQVGELEDSLKSTKSKLKDAEGQVKHLVEALKIAQNERDELQTKYSATEFSYLECKEALVETQERAANLRERYDTLVTELDGMVEAGCIIPTAEELQAAKARAKGTSKKHTSSKPKGSSTSQKVKLKDKSVASGGSLTAGGSDSLEGDGGGSIELQEGSTEASDLFREISCNNKDAAKEPVKDAKRDASNEVGNGKDFRNPEGVKFQSRAKREDTDFEGQLLENRAVRHGDVLAAEVAHLNRVIEGMRAEHEEVLHKLELGNKAVESGQNKLSAEVTRLNAKRKELAAQNMKLKEELDAKNQKVEELETQSKELLLQVEELQKKPVVTEIETLTGASLLEHDPGAMVFDDELTTPGTRGRHRRQSSGGHDDVGVMWGNHEATDYDDSFDPNAYISEPPVDAATQAGASASDFQDCGTQFPYLQDPDWQQNNVAAQTNAADFMYPTEMYLETLFRDFISESQTFIPPQNLCILQLSRFNETDKEKASRLGMRDEERPPLVEEEAQFRVKRALCYLSALNDLRNKHIKFVNKTGSWNTANTRMVIRCLDLVLQTTHNVLCPVVMLEDSDYSELRRATDPGEEAYYSDEGDHSQVFGEMRDITDKWKRSAKAVIKRQSTFKLTESELVSDHNYGAPKGILNTSEGQTLSKAVVKYMNRAVRPRRTVGNADHLLELAEGKDAPLEKVLSHRNSAPPSRSSAGADNSRDSSISPPRSAHSSNLSASPSISAFAAKALAVAAFAYNSGSDSSPEASPAMARFRKRMSTTMPLPEEPESADNSVIMSETAPPLILANQEKETRVIDGYYNFGRDAPIESADVSEKRATAAATVELPAEVVGMDTLSNVKVRVNGEKPVGISFQINEPSSDDQSTNLPDVPRGRKASRSPTKKGSVGYISAAALASGDFVDYTRIPFDARSAENAYTGKKMSVSGISAVYRKASTKGRSHSKSHSSGGYSSGEEDRTRAILADASVVHRTAEPPALVDGVEITDDIATRAQTAEAPSEAAAEDEVKEGNLPEGLDLQMYINQMDRPVERARSSHSALPALVDPPAGGTGSEKVTFAEAVGSRPVSSQAGTKTTNSRVGTASEKEKRADLRTPTLSERADRLQLGTPLPPPQPGAFAALNSMEGLDSLQTSSGGAAALKALLQRNIEASAMAVYQLHDQQKRRDQQGPGVPIDPSAIITTGKAGIHSRGASGDASVVSQGSGGGVHPPSRLKPSAHAKSSRNPRHKTKEIDWSNGAIPVVGPAGATYASWGGSAAPSAAPSATSSLLLSSLTGAGASATSRGDSYQLPLDGSFDFGKMMSGSPRLASNAAGDWQDEVVIRNASPVDASWGSQYHSAQQQQHQSEFVIAGQKRANLTKKEKVTNTVLFM